MYGKSGVPLCLIPQPASCCAQNLTAGSALRRFPQNLDSLLTFESWLVSHGSGLPKGNALLYKFIVLNSPKNTIVVTSAAVVATAQPPSRAAVS